MNDLDKFAALLNEKWGEKTLEEFRIEAESGATGIAFTALSAPPVKRAILIVCVADIDQVARLERVFDFVENPEVVDWNTLTLVGLAARTARGPGFGHESLRDEFNRRIAVVLTSTEPRSMAMLQSLFGI